MDGSVGALIDNKPIICGGGHTDKCFTYTPSSGWEESEPLDGERIWASSVKIDDETWWIGGGRRDVDELSSSIIYKVRRIECNQLCAFYYPH